MQTVVSLSDEFYAHANERARRDGQTMTALVEDALRRELNRRDLNPAVRPALTLAPTTGSGGLCTGVDLSNNAVLLVIVDEH